jgi:hypothetical protein
MEAAMMFKRLDKLVNSINFRKVIKWYLVFVLVMAVLVIACGGYIFRDKIALTMKYHQIEEKIEKQGLDQSIENELGAFAASSTEIKDVLLLERDNTIVYSAKNIGLGKDNKLKLSRVNDKGQFFRDSDIPNVYFKLIGTRNLFFINESHLKDMCRDLKEIRRELDDDFFYDSNYNAQNIYYLNYFADKKNGMKVIIVYDPQIIPYAKVFLGFTAAVLMLILSLYWILTALWVYRDANQRKLNAPLWGLLILLTNLVGLIVYTIYKQSNLACSKCGALQNKLNTFCCHCGNKMNDTCEKCGTIVAKNDDFCTHCGHKLK